MIWIGTDGNKTKTLTYDPAKPPVETLSTVIIKYRLTKLDS